MPLQAEGINDATLDEAVAFVRSANPFAQHVWGWNTGRFIDWRWAGNAVRNPDPAWFAEHGTIFRDDGDVRAIAVAEYGGADACILTMAEDPDAVAEIIPILIRRHHARGDDLNLEFSESAEWLRSLCAAAGMTEEANVCYEWEYDLSRLPDARPLPEGFTIATLAETGDAAYDGIAACINAAFSPQTDPALVLRSLEASPMHDPRLSVFVLAPDGRVAAYCRGEVDPDNGICGIDPVCTHPDFQKKGLGRAVVVRCLENQQGLGGRYSFIGSAPEPAPGVHLYRSLGPSTVRPACGWSVPAPAPAG